MKVLVLGATGFIGTGIIQAFARAGHIVYAQTRSENKAKQLKLAEVVPIICDPTTEEGRKVWSNIAQDCDVESLTMAISGIRHINRWLSADGFIRAVIDTVPAMGPEGPLATFRQIVSIGKPRPAGTKITYIYTGGSWVHSLGPGGLETWNDERRPHTGRNALTKWRWDVEGEVLASTDVNGIVIRPSVLYGKDGSLFRDLVFKPAYEAAKKGGKFETPCLSDARFLTIHPDDLGEMYLQAAERGPICKGQAMVGANPQSERLADILDAVVRCSGAKGYTTQEPGDNGEARLTISSHCGLTIITLAYLRLLRRVDLHHQSQTFSAHALTGWTPRKMGLVDGMDLYWAAFVATL